MRMRQKDTSPLAKNHNPQEQISQRVFALNQQIRDIADSSARYREQTVHTRLDRSAHQMRELRLLQIREELRQMLERHT